MRPTQKQRTPRPAPAAPDSTSRSAQAARPETFGDLLDLMYCPAEAAPSSSERPELRRIDLVARLFEAFGRSAPEDQHVWPHLGRTAQVKAFLAFAGAEELWSWLRESGNESGAKLLHEARFLLLGGEIENLRVEDRWAEALDASLRAPGLNGNAAAALEAEGRALGALHMQAARSAARNAAALRDLEARVRAAPVRILAASPYEPTMTAKEVGAVFWPEESLSVERVCDRFRPERVPEALSMFCPGGAGRSGKHFIARIVHEVAESARPTLDAMSERARSARAARVAERERREYQGALPGAARTKRA